MTDFSSVPRSKFLVTAGFSARAVLLKGCIGNPSEAGGGNTQNATTAEPVTNINPEQAPYSFSGELDGYDVQLAAMVEQYPDKTLAGILRVLGYNLQYLSN